MSEVSQPDAEAALAAAQAQYDQAQAALAEFEARKADALAALKAEAAERHGHYRACGAALRRARAALADALRQTVEG